MIVQAIIALLAFQAVLGASEYYVDGTHGSDTNSGTIDKPFKTLEKARDTIRSLKSSTGLPNGGVTVNIREGLYDLSAGPFELTSSDSGTAQSIITWQSYKSESVMLSAGRSIPSSLWKPVKDVEILKLIKSSPMQVNLKSMGITDYGSLLPGGLGDCANDKLNMYWEGEPMILARHPNINKTTGYPNWWNIADIVSTATAFSYSGTEPSAWTKAKDLWLHGYWAFDWADSYVHVKSIDTSTSTFYIDPNTPPVYEFKKPARYYAVNLIEALDVPGEYYLDRDTGILYFLPPSALDFSASQAIVSMSPNAVTVTGASYITFKNLDIQYARKTGIEFQNVDNVEFIGGDLSNNDGNSLRLSGTNSNVTGITSQNCGCSALSVEGGDLKTLARGNVRLTHSTVSKWARWKRTYQPALGFGGVGNYYGYNTVSFGPHTGIFGSGNDNIFEYNHVHDMCYEVSDSGSFYTGRNWARRGNIIRFNTFENVRNHEKTVLGYPSVQAVYLDDEMSGFEIHDNKFINCQTGTFIGGGRRNKVYNNYYEQCDTAVHLDDRGLSWQHAACSQKNGTLQESLFEVNYQNPPYSVHYPYLPNLLNDHPCTPVYNTVHDNTYCNCTHFSDASEKDIESWLSNYENNNEKC